MASRIITLIVCVLICFSLTSCTTVVLKSKHYVGTQLQLDEEALNEESLWQWGDRVFHVRVVDPPTIVASTLSWDDSKKAYEVMNVSIVMTELEGNTFLNIKGEQDEFYTILRLAPALSGDLVVFTGDKDNIRKHVADGRLKAIEKNQEFTLTLSKKELDSYFQEHQGEIFDFNQAAIIRPVRGLGEIPRVEFNPSGKDGDTRSLQRSTSD